MIRCTGVSFARPVQRRALPVTCCHPNGGYGQIASLSRDFVSASMPSSGLSERRLQQFLDAEVTHFAAMKRESLTLEALLQAAASPRHAALQVHEEIPKHFAARIRQIEEFDDYQNDEILMDLHSRYSESFREMRMAEVDDDFTEFTEVVRRLKERQKRALPLVGEMLKRRGKSVHGDEREFWLKWLHRFLRSRISTEMLTSQYITIMKQMHAGKTSITGIVDPECDPAFICQASIEHAKRLCLAHTGVCPVVEVEVRSKRSHAFSYIPIYLHYVLLEVLKNSCQATARASLNSTSCSDPVNEKKIHVVICSDNHRVAMRISDVAGGIPFEVGDRIWDFGFSGTSATLEADPTTATPLSGFGLGLPLARLYAGYLGGSLSMVSLPDYGVDTYLSLPRIDIAPFLPEDSGESAAKV